MENKELTALIVRAQSGDQAAMEELLRTAHTSVSYQCRKMLRNPRDAEDMTQEVLLTVYTRLEKLKNPATFWGWLNTITANRCVSAIKRNHVEYQFAEDEDGHSVLDDLEELDEQQVPDKALDNTETTRMIEEIVDGLPDAQRICVLMYYYDEMSVKDIAETLGVPENTVKSRLNYARKGVKERVLDYEKQGVKLYGLSPLPFLLFFLRRAAAGSADSAKAGAMAKRVMESASAIGGGAAAGAGSGAAAGAGGAAGGASTAAGTSAAAGGAAAAGTAVSHGLGGLSVKLIAGVLAGLLAVGGATAAVVTVVRDRAEPAAMETLSVETQAVPGAQTAAPEPAEEVTEEPVKDELIPAERLALLSDIKYYGDPAQCRMTVNQALAFAELLETGADAPYAALIDIGEGSPVLALARGTDGGAFLRTPESNPTSLHRFHGKLEVWRYADGQAELAAATHEARWQAGVGFVCQTRVGGVFDENGELLPDADYFHYLDYTEDVYSVEGGVLSASPISSAYAGVDPGPRTVSGGTIDGQPVGEAEWQSLWEQQWGSWSDSSWTTIGVGYDAEIGGHVDSGLLNTDTVSPGSDVADVLRQCAEK